MDFRMIGRLLGQLSMAFSVMIILPLLIALIMDQENILAFALTLIISISLSYGLRYYSSTLSRERLRSREALAVVGCGWLLVCLLGSIPYIVSGELNPIRALFESVSGFTTTGVTTVNSFSEFSPSVLVWRTMTHWCGGIGVIMLFIIIMPQINGSTGFLFNAELPGAIAERSLPRIKESALLIAKIYASMTLLEVFLLLIGGMNPVQAMNLAVATMATGGFTFFHDSLVMFSSTYNEIIALTFMLIASMNFALYYRAWIGDWQTIKEETEYRYYLALLAIAGVLITLNLYFSGYASLWESFRHGIFHAISVGSTTGFAADDFDTWPSFSRYTLLILMFIGGCSGSTAGGIKISRTVILLKAAWAELLRILHPRIVYAVKLGDRTIDASRVGSITRFFFLYIMVFVVLTVLISLTGCTVMEAMGMIAACLSSVGPAFGLVGPTGTYSQLSTYGQIIIIFAMLLGRLEMFTLLIILRPDFWSRKMNW